MSREGGFDPSLLPGDPWVFFGLGEGSGEKDLRRAYFAAVRLYRPETHPEEFQRIREGYERLLAWFREGNLDPAPLSPEAAPPRESLATPAERARLSRDLAAAPSSPRDHLLLALLADVEDSPRGSFGIRLLRGLGSHPGDAGLTALFRAFLESEVPPDRLPEILQAASAKIPGSAFWTATEPAWEVVAASLSFGEVRRLWEAVSPREDGLDEGPRARVMCRVLPHLAPSAPRSFLEPWESWIHERQHLVEGAEEVLDVLESCRSLQALRERETRKSGPGAGGAPVPRRMKERAPPAPSFPEGAVGRVVQDLVQAVFSARGPGGAERLRRAARAVLAARSEVERAFAPPDRALAGVLSSLPRVSFLLARHLLPPTSVMESLEESRLVRTVHGNAELALSRKGVRFREMLRALGRALPDPADVLQTVVALVLGILGIVGTIQAAVGLGAFGAGSLRFWFGMGLVAVSFAGFRWGFPRLPKAQDRRPEKVRERQLRRLYLDVVRGPTVHAVTELGIVPAALVDGRCVAAERSNPVLVQGVAEDPALPILWTAHRFAH